MSVPSDTNNPRRGLNRSAADACNLACAELGAVLALAAIGDFTSLKNHIISVLDNGLRPDLIQEILLEAHLFGGFPRAICALKLFREAVGRRGIKRSAHVKTEGRRTPRRLVRGKKLFRRVYGKNARAVLKSLHSLHPQYDRWVLEDAYGRVLSRPYLPGKWRELCAVAALTVSAVPMQLRSHILGAAHMGAGRAEIEGIIVFMRSFTDQEKIDDALEILAEINLK